MRTIARTAIAIAIALSHPAAQQEPMHVTGVRLDNAFRLVGSDSSGLVVAVTVDKLNRQATTGDFTLFVFNDQGRRSGEIGCLAIRFLDGPDPNPPWIRLDGPQRKQAIERAGRYEFVFLIGPTAKQGALAYGENRPDVARVPIGSFKVPWP